MNNKNIDLSKAAIKEYCERMNKILKKIQDEDKSVHKQEPLLDQLLSKYDAEIKKLRKVKSFDSTTLELISASLHCAINEISYDMGVTHGVLLACEMFNLGPLMQTAQKAGISIKDFTNPKYFIYYEAQKK